MRDFLILLGGLLIGIIDTYTIVKQRERLKRQKLEFELDNVKMHYETEAGSKYYEYLKKHEDVYKKRNEKAIKYLESQLANENVKENIMAIGICLKTKDIVEGVERKSI